MLNENLTASTTWRSVMEIQKLSGDSDLIMNRGSFGIMHLHINKVDATAGMNLKFDRDMNAILGADANAQHTIGGTITNKASLTINGAITITDNLIAFTELEKGQESGELSINGTDGYMTVTGSTYLLVDNEGDGAKCTLGSMTATYGGNTIQLRQDTTTGDVTFIGGSTYDTIYRVNTFDVTAGGTNPTADTGRARSFEIAKDRTLTIAGATDNASVSELLVNSTGEGNITLTTNVQLVANDVTKATGTLTIGDDVELRLGNGDLWDSGSKTATGTGADISSFTAVNLDNGTIRIQNPSATIQNLTVTANGGVIDANDLANDPERYKINLLGNTTLNGILTYKNEWNTCTEIENLTGSGNLIIDGSIRSEQDNSTFSILNATNYDGIVQMTNKANNMSLKVAQNLGLDVKVGTTSGEIDLTGIGSGNTITLAAAVGGIKSGTIAADVVVTNATVGNNLKAGMEVTTATDNTAIVYTGKFSGSGNYIIGAQKTVDGQQVNVTTSTTFSGDTSEFTGQLRVSKGEQNITFTGDATTVKSNLVVDEGATANVTLDHTQAATVTKALNPAGTLNLVVKNTAAEGTTFSGSVQATTATIKAGTVAKFTNAEVQMTNLLVETGAQLAFTAKDALNVSNLSVANVGTLTVANGDVAGSLSASGAVTLNGGATINAAVVDLSDASSVSFDVTPTPGTGITLNGALTMSSTKAFVDALDLTSLSAGDILTVFTGVSSFTVGDVTYDASNALTNVDLRDWGADAAVGQYTLTYDTSANVGSIVITVGEVIPEPASATLSLAALMMLCARRRRRA